MRCSTVDSGFSIVMSVTIKPRTKVADCEGCAPFDASKAQYLSHLLTIFSLTASWGN